MEQEVSILVKKYNRYCLHPSWHKDVFEMNEEIEYINHSIITPAVKEQHWGPGEWVNEPDLFRFEYKGFVCCGVRTCGWEGFNNEHLFGGYWCGYVEIPPGHPWHGKEMGDIEVDCHYGLSLSRKNPEREDWVIGFDCAHSGDLMPSLQKFKERFDKDPNFAWLNYDDMKKKFPNCTLFHNEYRNIEYVVSQCRYIAEQADLALIPTDF